MLGHTLTLLNASEPLPFLPDELQEVSEEVRYQYRYIDLRREGMQRHLKQRYQLIYLIRQFLHAQGFIEIETPMLTKATPEGARDYLVPSRVHPGSFYALPQSPQLFKQLLMMSGFDKYYQVVRCFRDEDLRADRQPEFTQLDLEMSFITEKDIQILMESCLREVFTTLLQITLPDPFPRMTYQEAIQRFGSDKPDLRIPLELVDIGDLVAQESFAVFSEAALNPLGRVVAMRVPHAHQLSRKQLDNYTQFVVKLGAKGLAYLKVNNMPTDLQSSLLKFLSSECLSAILNKIHAQTGDLVLFGAGIATTVNESMGALRLKLGHDLGLVRAGWAPLWVVDWPMFERNPETHRLQAMHHPFTSPQILDETLLKNQPEHCLAKAYDLVINGYEIGGGSIRIHSRALQQVIFDLLDIGAVEAEEKFGFLLKALQHGCPPHGGIALGLDRLAMLLAGATSIREVIAFPKTQSAVCLLTQAPSPIDKETLKDLGDCDAHENLTHRMGV